MTFKKFCSFAHENRSAPARLKKMTQRLWPEVFKTKIFPSGEEVGKIITAMKYKLVNKEMLINGQEASKKFEENFYKAIKFFLTSDISELYLKGFNRIEKGEDKMKIKITKKSEVKVEKKAMRKNSTKKSIKKFAVKNGVI